MTRTQRTARPDAGGSAASPVATAARSEARVRPPAASDATPVAAVARTTDYRTANRGDLR